MANNPGSFRPGQGRGTNQQQAGYAYAPGMSDPGYYQSRTGTPTPDTVPTVTPDTSGSGDSGGGYDEDWETRRMREAQAYDRARSQRQTLEVVKAAFAQYGLQSLYAKIEEYVRGDYSADMIAIMLRETPEYKQRFPAMAALAARGRAISEGQYIEYEQTAAALEQRYGLPSGMLVNNVTDLLTNEVSASEMNERVVLASAASLEAPDDLKRTMRDYYGIDEGGLTAYYLDPDIALPLLEKQYATAQIGTQASRQGVGIDREFAAELQGLGVTNERAEDGFAQVASAKEFEVGKGETISQRDLARGAFGNADAAAKARRVAESRQGRFAGGGGFVGDQKGVSGLGSS